MSIRGITCREEGCQCEQCARNSIMCCVNRPISCPDSRDYDPSYVCPDFILRGVVELEERCPACGGPVKLKTKMRNSTQKFKLVCNGDCWTETGWHDTIDAAREEWHRIRQQREEESDNAAE